MSLRRVWTAAIAGAALGAAAPGCASLFPDPDRPPAAPVESAEPIEPMVADTAAGPPARRVRPEPDDPRAEILWDTWGVPHIFAVDEPALFHAFGWSQMRNHGDLLLRLYGQARGRAAEYWGEGWLESDRWVRTNGIPDRARAWLDVQAPHVRAWLDAFTDGINQYAEEYGDELSAELLAVLPIEPADVLAHTQRVIHFTFVTNPDAVAAQVRAWSGRADAPAPRVPLPAAASNAWAIAPARTTSGHAILMANPHLPWDDLYTFFEAQLVSPNIDAYGAVLIGLPLLSIAFTDVLGWTHTVNTYDGTDLYELTLEGGGYRWNGATRAFDTVLDTLRVRQPDGTVATEPFEVRRSVHGPVVGMRGDRALALRVAGLDAPHLLEQQFEMLRSRSRVEFEAALARLQMPMFTVMYADRAGHILHVFNGRVPLRGFGTWRDWQAVQRGDTSATLWTEVHAYDELPRVLDPHTGWLQNANDPPWTTTFPPALDPGRYPAYMAPRGPLAFRPMRSARMLAEASTLSFEDVVRLRHSTRMELADHLIDDLVVTARAHGTVQARRAADVLQRWDRNTDADSRGAVLFQAFWRELQRRGGGSPFEIPWTETAPFSTPDGLADPAGAVAALAAAAADVERRHGALDAAWGDVHRLRRDTVDLPANGGPGELGIFRVTSFSPGEDGTGTAVFGDSYVAVIEFGQPVRAMTVIGYGNASQPGSPHRVDQLPLYAAQTLRPVWRSRAEVEANLRDREAF